LAAHKLPRDTVEEQRRRDLTIQQAFQGAVEAPLEIARKAVEVFERLGQLESMSAPSMLSDVRVGRMMAATAARGALENVATNLESITDAAFVGRARSEARSIALRIAESPAVGSG
jgi:formiminotetrahydrofolate cyclodeaminase